MLSFKYKLRALNMTHLGMLKGSFISYTLLMKIETAFKG
jgi:hypothetical protein